MKFEDLQVGDPVICHGSGFYGKTTSIKAIDRITKTQIQIKVSGTVSRYNRRTGYVIGGYNAYIEIPESEDHLKEVREAILHKNLVVRIQKLTKDREEMLKRPTNVLKQVYALLQEEGETE